MTKEELKSEIELVLKNKPPYMRDGQWIFNYMDYTYGASIIQKVQQEDRVDCFYRNDKVEEFLECCLKRINNR